jgi:large subunit ribosomal protein L9
VARFQAACKKTGFGPPSLNRILPARPIQRAPIFQENDMKVILTENVQALGQIGELVNVAPGYARNFLLPQKLAMEATGKNVRQLDHKKRELEKKREKLHQETLSFAEKLNGVTITLRRKVADDEKLYGSVSVADVGKELENKGFDLDRKTIHLDQPIKQLGEFTVAIRLDARVSAQVRVVVEKEE